MPVRAEARRAVRVPPNLTPDAMQDFETNLKTALHPAPRMMSLDCSRLEHITSGYVKVLWWAHEECARAGAAVHLQDPPAGLIRTLRVMDLAPFFGVCESPCTGEETEVNAAPARGGGTYSDRFRPDEPGIDAALRRFVGFLARTGTSETAGFELRTVFYEMATNIRLHAHTNPGDETVCTATAGEEKITLTFRYKGSAFDPTRHSRTLDFVAAARAGKTRGFGLAMIHRLTDRILYSRDEGGWNVVTVEKGRSVHA